LEARIGANDAACFLAFILPICWTQFRRERGLFRILNLIVLIAIPPTLVVTASRTGFVIFIVILIAMLVTQRTTKTKVLWVILLLILLGLFFLIPAQSAFITRLATLSDPIAALNVDRTALWKAALLWIKENPIIGGNYRANVQRLVLEVAPQSNYARHLIMGTSNLDLGVHEGYLAVMTDFGIPIGLLYIGFFLSLGKGLLNTIKKIRDEKNRNFLIAGFICMIGYAISNFTLHYYISVELLILWAVLQSSIKNALLEETNTG